MLLPATRLVRLAPTRPSCCAATGRRCWSWRRAAASRSSSRSCSPGARPTASGAGRAGSSSGSLAAAAALPLRQRCSPLLCSASVHGAPAESWTCCRAAAMLASASSTGARCCSACRPSGPRARRCRRRWQCGLWSSQSLRRRWQRARAAAACWRRSCCRCVLRRRKLVAAWVHGQGGAAAARRFVLPWE